MSSNIVRKFYQDVVEQLFTQSKIFWDEEAADETSMTDLKQLWETKLSESGIDLNRDNVSGADGEQTTKTSGRGSRAKNQANAAAVLAAQPGLASSQNTSKTGQHPHNQQQQFQQQQILQEQHQQQSRQQQQQQQQQQNQRQQQQQYLQAQQQAHASHQILQNTGMNLNQTQVIVNQKQHNFSGGQPFSLLSSSVPLSGPIVHLSSTVPTSSSVISGLQRSQQNPSFVTVGGTPMILGNRVMQQNMQQHQGQMQSNTDQRAGTVIQQNPRGEQLSSQHGRQPAAAAVQNHQGQDSMTQQGRQQPNILTYGNLQQFNMNHIHPNNHNTIFAMGNQIFHHGGLGGHQSVIHIVDSSGNQQPMNAVNPSGSNASNGVNASTPGGALRKPGQPLTAQLDGADDDDDFVDLSDDEANPASVDRPTKKLKSSKVASERLEEPDLGSEDDDDNDPTSVVEVVDNVVVCQYEKVSRTRNKWKLHLKSGMCSLNGKEYIFHKAVGDAEF